MKSKNILFISTHSGKRGKSGLASNRISSNSLSGKSKTLFESAPDSTIIVNKSGKIALINRQTEKLFGYDEKELLGKCFEFLVPQIRKKLTAGNTDDFFENPKTCRLEGSSKLYGVRKNGRRFSVDISLSPLPIGKQVCSWVAVRDITEWQQIEDDSKLGQAYTRSLIEASLDPLMTISPQGKITDVNEASIRLTGVPREKLIGADFSDYFTEPEKAQDGHHVVFDHFTEPEKAHDPLNALDGYQQVFAKGFIANSLLTLRNKGGQLTDVLYNATVYKDGLGNVIGMLVTARDITAQRKQEIRIQTLNEELEQRIIELESFSYSVSHDLRAPLRGIDGFIAIFLTKYLDKVDHEGQRLLGNVRRNVDKMGSLIDELLALSRIGMKDIQIVTINMTELVNAVLEELTELKGNSRVVVTKLGAAKGDIALLKQVLVNLISNAFKYSNKKASPKIEIGSKISGYETQYYIKDNGVGFDMEYSNKLFGVFQRLHDPEEYQGTGVGLAIVKRIIIRHGGRVWAEGKEGIGATFYFSLKSP